MAENTDGDQNTEDQKPITDSPITAAQMQNAVNIPFECSHCNIRFTVESYGPMPLRWVYCPNCRQETKSSVKPTAWLEAEESPSRWWGFHGMEIVTIGRALLEQTGNRYAEKLSDEAFREKGRRDPDSDWE